MIVYYIATKMYSKNINLFKKTKTIWVFVEIIWQSHIVGNDCWVGKWYKFPICIAFPYNNSVIAESLHHQITDIIKWITNTFTK